MEEGHKVPEYSAEQLKFIENSADKIFAYLTLGMLHSITYITSIETLDLKTEAENLNLDVDDAREAVRARLIEKIDAFTKEKLENSLDESRLQEFQNVKTIGNEQVDKHFGSSK